MTASLIVHFTCRGCGTTYTAMQNRSRTRQSGHFDCEDCGDRVYEWAAEFYSYFDWKPYTIRLLHLGTKF